MEGYIRYRVGLLGDWEGCQYYVKYEDALRRYLELCNMFDNVHLSEMTISERIIDGNIDPMKV